MTLQDRMNQADRQTTATRTGSEYIAGASAQGKPRVSLFPATRYGIVDHEIVEVLGQDDIPGMSPVLWCSDLTTGAYVPVPIREVRHFATAGQALQALQAELKYSKTR